MFFHTNNISVWPDRHTKEPCCTSFTEVFSLLSEMNFFYEQKKRFLLPYYESVQQTWNLLLTCTDDIAHHTLVVPDKKVTAICSSWRSSKDCWIIQNGIASNIRNYINALVLESSFLLKQPSMHYIQAWFNPANRIVKKMCGLGAPLYEQSGVYEESTFCIHWEPMRSLSDDTYQIYSFRSTNRDDFQEFIKENRSQLFYECGDFSDDSDLSKINAVFNNSGLFRSRFIDVVHSAAGIQAVVISYYSSPGISFSFLENNTEIIVGKSADLTPTLLSAIGEVIIKRTKSWTTPRPIITDRRTGTVLIQYHGATMIREYSRRIWTKKAYGALYDYILTKYC